MKLDIDFLLSLIDSLQSEVKTAVNAAREEDAKICENVRHFMSEVYAEEIRSKIIP